MQSYSADRSQDVCVVIPTYNGWTNLRRCLDSLSTLDSQILVVDDAGSDETACMLQHGSGNVRYLQRRVNGGFSVAVNAGIRATDGEFIVLLNNDVEVSPGFLDTILPLFDDETVFSVSPSIVLPKRGNIDEGCKTGVWHHGIFHPGQRENVKELASILYTTGCAAVYRRSMLEALGGFDEAYSPFYWEDADLGYRAWKRGWKSLYQPDSIVYHQHSASISKVNAHYTSRIKARNSLLFVWRNIDDANLLSWHKRWLPLVLARRGLAGDFAFFDGWRAAYAQREEAEQARIRDAANRALSDRDIFSAVRIEVPS